MDRFVLAAIIGLVVVVLGTALVGTFGTAGGAVEDTVRVCVCSRDYAVDCCKSGKVRVAAWPGVSGACSGRSGAEGDDGAGEFVEALAGVESRLKGSL